MRSESVLTDTKLGLILENTEICSRGNIYTYIYIYIYSEPELQYSSQNLGAFSSVTRQCFFHK